MSTPSPRSVRGDDARRDASPVRNDAPAPGRGDAPAMGRNDGSAAGRARVVSTESDVRAVAAAAARAERIAFDVEASGMFAYRARPCTVQLAWDGGERIAVVDVLAAPLAPLARLLGPDGPVKIVHDVAFDARLLA